MLRIAVCDDSSYIRGEIKKCLLKYSFEKNIDVHIDEYESGELLLETEKSEDRGHNLIFMDYEFEEKGSNGIFIINELRKFNQDTKVIFVSAYSQVVFQSFEVDTFRFLVKPLEQEKLFKAMDDFMNLAAKKRIFEICVNGEKFLYYEENIIYIEGSGKNCIIHFADSHEDVISHETLSSVEMRLSKDDFFRCHKSFLINMAYINSYNHKEIMLNNGKLISISRGKYKEFAAVLTDYISGKGGI